MVLIFFYTLGKQKTVTCFAVNVLDLHIQYLSGIHRKSGQWKVESWQWKDNVDCISAQASFEPLLAIFHIYHFSLNLLPWHHCYPCLAWVILSTNKLNSLHIEKNFIKFQILFSYIFNNFQHHICMWKLERNGL